MSTAERTQFHLGAGDESVVEDLAGFEHNQWPSGLELDRTKLTRIAVRVLWAHAAADASQKEWVAVRGQKRVEELLLIRKPEANSRVKFDVALDEADHHRLQQLIEMKVVDSETAGLRVAIAHLRDLVKELKRDRHLMARWRGGTAHEQVELVSIVLDTAPVVVARGFLFPLQADPTPSQAPQYVGAVRTREEELAAVLFLVLAFNRFLATRIAWLNAESITTDAAALTTTEVETIQRDFELLSLFDEFCFRGKAELRKQFEEHQLLPQAWPRDDHTFNRWVTTGQKAVRDYLVARSENLSPWPGSTERSKHWRNWTRSHLVVERGIEYRECVAALEWTAVIHHWLINHDGVSPEMVAHELQTWLVQAFGVRNNDHVERLAQSCKRLNEAFFDGEAQGSTVHGRNGKRVKLQTLLYDLACLKKTRTAEEEARAVREESEPMVWARFVYVVASSARVITGAYKWRRYTTPSFDEVEPSVLCLTRAELSEFRARVFGGQTAIDGLHWILHGGIVPRVHSGRSWLIYGKPGCGKSTLALHLAADMARRGRVSVVFSDERSEVIAERLLMFGLRADRDRFDVIDRKSFEELLSAERPKELDHQVRGLLVVFNATREEPKQDLAQWLSMVSVRARELRESFAHEAKETSKPERADALLRLQRRWRWLSVVVDSIDALEVESRTTRAEATDERTAMAELVRVIEMSRFWGIFVSGIHGARKDIISDLTDAVVELEVADSGMHRTLQFLKCRTQPYDSGKHVFELREERGVEIYPNLASIQRRVRRRARPPLDRERVIPLPRHVFWPEGPEREAVDSTPNADESTNAPPEWPSIRRGSAVLMYGAAQTGKSPFLMNLISQRIQLVDRRNWRLGTNGATLIVSFRSSANELVRSLQESNGLRAQWLNNVSTMGFCDYGVDETLVGSQIAFELIRRIRRFRRDAVPLDWIAFVGLETLPFNLPHVASEPSFWPTIFAIAANEGISTAFMIDDENRTSEFVTQHSQEMDYVLRFSRRDCARVMTIEKSADPPPRSGYPTFEFDPAQGPVTLVART